MRHSLTALQRRAAYVAVMTVQDSLHHIGLRTRERRAFGMSPDHKSPAAFAPNPLDARRRIGSAQAGPARSWREAAGAAAFLGAK